MNRTQKRVLNVARAFCVFVIIALSNEVISFIFENFVPAESWLATLNSSIGFSITLFQAIVCILFLIFVFIFLSPLISRYFLFRSETLVDSVIKRSCKEFDEYVMDHVLESVWLDLNLLAKSVVADGASYRLVSDNDISENIKEPISQITVFVETEANYVSPLWHYPKLPEKVTESLKLFSGSHSESHKRADIRNEDRGMAGYTYIESQLTTEHITNRFLIKRRFENNAYQGCDCYIVQREEDGSPQMSQSPFAYYKDLGTYELMLYANITMPIKSIMNGQRGNTVGVLCVDSTSIHKIFLPSIEKEIEKVAKTLSVLLQIRQSITSDIGIETARRIIEEV